MNRNVKKLLAKIFPNETSTFFIYPSLEMTAESFYPKFSPFTILIPLCTLQKTMSCNAASNTLLGAVAVFYVCAV